MATPVTTTTIDSSLFPPATFLATAVPPKTPTTLPYAIHYASKTHGSKLVTRHARPSSESEDDSLLSYTSPKHSTRNSLTDHPEESLLANTLQDDTISKKRAVLIRLVLSDQLVMGPVATGLPVDPVLLVSSWFQNVALGLTHGRLSSPALPLPRWTKHSGSCDPMLPPYALRREERARPPRPVRHRGRLYDVMGVALKDRLILRDQQVMHQDVRVEHFAGRPVLLDGVLWRAVSIEPFLGPLNVVLQLVHPDNPLQKLIITGTNIDRVRFPSGSNSGLHLLGGLKHGIARLVPMAPKAERRIHLRPGHRFEARLRNRELEGPYTIEVGDKGRFTATGVDQHGLWRRMPVKPDDIAPRYEIVTSPDFGGHFHVDAFLFNEDQLRCRATRVGKDPGGRPIQDPLFGSLAPGGGAPRLTNGAKHLAVFEEFIRHHTNPDTDTGIESRTMPGAPPHQQRRPRRRRLTMLNISMCNQGDAHCVLDALVDFRRHNPDADMFVVVSKLGPAEFQASPEFQQFVQVLEDNHIQINLFTGADNSTRQVVHGKAILVDDHVLFSTGSVMDTWPINKSDFSIELPPAAAALFRQYTDEAILSDNASSACHRRRQVELAAALASQGVIINDPVTGLTYISRAQDALIRGASWELVVSVSELVDPAITQTLISRAATGGVEVVIQVRELDPVSRWLLDDATAKYSNLRLEDSSWWEPRPHFNAIVADRETAYVGTSYLWQTQRNMIHQGRSFENGVLLDGDAARCILTQINQLRDWAYSGGGANPVASHP